MTYRTFKKLLGETSLERKCRFLFGGALMLLITGSFYFYAQLNLGVIRSQQRERAQLLLAQNLQTKHWSETQSIADPETIAFVQQLSQQLKPANLRENRWKFIPEDYENADPTRRPAEKSEYDALHQLLSVGAEYVVEEDDEDELYHYYELITASKSCLQCHRDLKHKPLVQAEGDVMGVAKLSFDLKETRQTIARNNAILIALALVTAFLAMLAAYAIVRYVIVKPIIHLKEVSDAIAQGNLDERANIRTGDEFQELSHAYNRMLKHLVATQRELTDERARADEKVDELAQANLSLHEMNKIKNEFLATMSHELRTPLNSILGFSDILKVAENLSDKQQKYVNNIETSGQNLLTLINDILDLAKIEAGRMELHIVEFSLDEVVDRLTSSMRPLAEKKNIDMSAEVDPELPILNQDVGKFQQIVYNLLSNAVKFTPDGGRIRVVAEPIDDQMFQLVVADTGIGIPLDDQAIIFAKFRQGTTPKSDSAMTREFEGTGLGLSIVKELSKLLGGEVSLQSEFGKGSTFTVTLPIALLCKNQIPDDDSRTSATADLLRQAESFRREQPRDAG